MIEMLEHFETMGISKMMLSVIPYMIKSPSNFIKNFFDLMICQPLIMQQEVSIPWPDNLDEFVFPSTTSLVNHKKTLIRELCCGGHLSADMVHHSDHHHHKEAEEDEDANLLFKMTSQE
jgi:hypothetical protein